MIKKMVGMEGLTKEIDLGIPAKSIKISKERETEVRGFKIPAPSQFYS
jgi:hypothetical protein